MHVLILFLDLANYRKLLLIKLFEHGYIGGRHTAVENLARGFPKHDRGMIARVVKELIREGLIFETNRLWSACFIKLCENNGNTRDSEPTVGFL
jgi:hypothetical protein